MGGWFANMSIRKEKTVTVDSVKEQLVSLMQARQYDLVELPEDADGALVFLTGENWITVCSELLPLEDLMNQNKG